MFRGSSQRQYQRIRTRADKKAAAIRLIAFATPERFAVLTPDDVAAHSGLAVAECAEMLALAKARKAGL